MRSLASKPLTCPSHLQLVRRAKSCLDLLHLDHMTQCHVSCAMSSFINTCVSFATSPSHLYRHGICCIHTCTYGLISCVSHIKIISLPKLVTQLSKPHKYLHAPTGARTIRFTLYELYRACPREDASFAARIYPREVTSSSVRRDRGQSTPACASTLHPPKQALLPAPAHVRQRAPPPTGEAMPARASLPAMSRTRAPPPLPRCTAL
jgi:hypothetical protein